MTRPRPKLSAGPRETHVGGSALSVRCADTAWCVTADHPLVFRDARDSYSSFLSVSRPDAATKVPVRVCVGEGPALEPSARLFDTGSMWSIYAAEKRQRLIVGRDFNLQPTRLWTAVLDAGAPAADVFCAAHCLRDAGGTSALVNPVVYPLDQVLSMYVLASRGGLVLHSCGFETDGRGVVLAGRSGAGKTTTARFLDPRGDATVFSDDRTVVRRTDAGWRVHGTPWPGDARIARQASAPLSALVFLTKSEHNAMVPIGRADALRRLLIVASVPWYDVDYMTPILETADRLLAEAPCYEFRFCNEPSAADELVAFARSLPPGPRLSRLAPEPV